MVPVCALETDRGMVWLFGYNHEEAIACFEGACRRSGLRAGALGHRLCAQGPNYNKPWEVFTPEEKAPALARAHRRAGGKGAGGG
jgi:hypothetical protein